MLRLTRDVLDYDVEYLHKRDLNKYLDNNKYHLVIMRYETLSAINNERPFHKRYDTLVHNNENLIACHLHS